MTTLIKYTALFVLIVVQNSCFAQSPYFGIDQQPILSQPISDFASSFQIAQPSAILSPLDTFISTFKNAVGSSSILSDVFNLGQVDIHAFAHFLYKALYTQVYKGFYNPEALKSYVYQPITENSTVVNYSMLVNMYANMIGNLLQAETLLNDSNAASLGNALVKEMEASAERLGGLSNLTAKFQALTDGFISVLKSQGLFMPYKLPVVAPYISKEVRLVSGATFVPAAGHGKERWS